MCTECEQKTDIKCGNLQKTENSVPMLFADRVLRVAYNATHNN